MKKIVSHLRRQAGNTNSKLIFALVGLSLLSLGAYAGINQRINNPSNQPTPMVTEVPAQVSPNISSPHVLIYGFWAADKSIIKAYNMETKTASVLAELPQNIKRITVTKPNSLYFINKTNRFDHGTEIVKAPFNGTPQTIITADPEFGIDDYYISPDGKYMTTWEVNLKDNETILYGGHSRVYSIDLSSPSTKNLLYDEVADKPIHYPRGITNTGMVVTDMFLPNSGPGWGYGMSMSDITGAQKVDVPAMINGSYGRQPRMSQDGSMLAFAGYDGTKGSGTEQIEGIRKAIIIPNTVEVIDAKTMQRKKLANISNKFLYDGTAIDQDGTHLLISQIRYLDNQYKTYVLLYDLEKSSAAVVPNSLNKRGFALLSDSQVLVSTPNKTGQTLGNLGESYQFLNASFGIINPKDGKSAVFPIADSNMQYIGLFPSSDIAAGSSGSEENRDALQLYSFTLKTNLLNDRIKLQATSRSSATPLSGANRLGIKTIAQVDNIIPVLPPNYTPEPGTSLPPCYRLPDNPNGEPICTNNPTSPANPTNPAVTQPPVTLPSNTVSMPPGASQAPVEDDAENPQLPEGLDIPEGGEIPDDIRSLIDLIRQLLGILEEESQN